MKNSYDSYNAWNINESKFPDNGAIEEKIKFILGYGILAPSTFNSQPWKCSLNGNILDIFLDKSKITKRSDKIQRFAHVSMGAFIENILVASDYFGLKTDLKISLDNSSNLRHVATIKFSEGNRNNNHLFDAIKKRTTNRSPSQDKVIERKIIDEILKIQAENIKINILNENNRDEIISISKTGDFNIWTDFGFRKEHVGWVRTNVTKKYDGMPAFGVNAGLIPSFLAPLMILSPIFPKFQIKKNIKALGSTKHFVVVCGEDKPEEWLVIGLVFEKISLMLANYGICVSPMGQFIEDDMARGMLDKLVNSGKDLRSQVFFRIGYPTLHVRHSPRHPANKILI